MEQLDAIIAALYETISGPAGAPRDWDRFRALFFTRAHLVRTSVAEDGTPRAAVMDVEEYIADVSAYFHANGFYEVEVARRVGRFGNIAHVFSVYEACHDLADATSFKRGINSIQLYYDGARWWVVNMLWDNERPGNPLPEEFLPGR